MKDSIEITKMPEQLKNYTESHLYQLLFTLVFKKSARLNALLETHQRENLENQVNICSRDSQKKTIPDYAEKKHL